MKTAVIQLNAGEDKRENIRKAVDLAAQASRKKADFIALPEVFHFRGILNERMRACIAEDIPGESLKPLMTLAEKLGIFILAGSIYERIRGSKKFYNSSAVIDDRGRIAAVYRKIHLFDAALEGRTIQESAQFKAGVRPVTVKVKKFCAGLSVCYDVRFPWLYQHYRNQGAHILCVPSAFTFETGRAHWEILLRARAIENLSWVVAPNQFGVDSRGVAAWGHSMIVNPWGEIMAEASADTEEIIYADIDEEFISKKRLIFFGQRGRIVKGGRI